MAWAPPPVPQRRASQYSPTPQYAQQPPPPVHAYYTPPPVPYRPAPSVSDDGLCRVRALFDFAGTADGDLVFKKGDVIIVTQKLAPGWWEGANTLSIFGCSLSDASGEQGQLGTEIGIFPLPYVEDYRPQPGLRSSSTGSFSAPSSTAAPAAPPPVPSRQTAAYLEAQRAILALSVTAHWHRSMVIEPLAEEDEYVEDGTDSYEEETTDEEPPVASVSYTDIADGADVVDAEAERQRLERERLETERLRAEQARWEEEERKRLAAEQAWREEQRRMQEQYQAELRKWEEARKEEARQEEARRQEESRQQQARKQEEIRQAEMRKDEQRRADEARREEMRKEEQRRKEEEARRVQEEEARKKESADRRTREAAEQRRLLQIASEAARKEQERIMEEARKEEERKQKEREKKDAERREAEEKRRRDDARRKEEEDKRKKEDDARRKQEEQKRAEESKKQEEQRRTEEQRKRERMEEAKRYEEQRQKEMQWRQDEMKRKEEEHKRAKAELQRQEEQRKAEEAKRRKEEEARRQQTAQQQRNMPVCTKCSKPISGRAMLAMDKTYHPTCFSCHKCNCALGSAFSPVNDVPHCADCARALLSSQRKNTSSADHLSAPSHRYNNSSAPSSHLSPSGNSALPNQKRHSKRQSTRVQQPPCAKCAKPLSGAVIEALGKSYHEGCFGCTQCGSAVTATFVQIGGQPFCDPCAKARFSKELRARSSQPDATPSNAPAPARPSLTNSNSNTRISPSSAQTQTSAPAGVTPTGGHTQWRGGLAHGTQALLEWCQANTKGYTGVNVTNWTTSWQDGLALCALIHHFFPSNINFTSLRAANKMDNIRLGIATAKRLGVPELLDAEDFGIEKLSMCTYVSELYKKLELKQ